MKKILVILIFVVCSACAQMEPSVRSQAPPPYTLQDRGQPPVRESDEGLVQEAGQEARNATQVLKQIDAGDRQFNQQLSTIMTASEKGQQKAKKQEKSKEQVVSGGKDVSFNFYDAELVEVIRVFMDLLQDDYVLHPDVQGRVSLSVDDTFTKQQFIDLVQGVLRINQMTMIRNAGVWEIMPIAVAPKHFSSTRIFIPDKGASPKRGQIIQAYRLQYIAATEMIKVIKPYLTEGAIIYAHDAKGVLLVSDYPHALNKVGQMVELFDESVFADIKAKAYTLKYAQAEKTAKELEQIAASFGLTADKGGPRSRVSFVALERTNVVAAVARSEKVLRFVDAWVQELDKALPASMLGQQGMNIFVYYVQYGDAETIVESLQGLFERESPSLTEEDDQKRIPVGQRMAQERQKEEEEQGQEEGQSPAGRDSVQGELSGEVTFQVDKITNSILTRCNRQDYQTILSVIEKLDLYPKQVLIEMVIAEVSLNDSSKLGVEWRYIMDLGSAEGTISLDSGLGAISAGDSQIGSGLSYLIENTNQLTAALKALAESGKVQILSTPSLLASDNKEATINIGDEVPIPTTTEEREDETGVATTVTTTLQYRNTGIILKVTPKINKHGMVRMEIEQEVSNLADVVVEGVSAPVISTRNTSTSVAVNDGYTIVIAGLIEQTQQRNNSGVPYLRRIPVLGNLFRYQDTSFENTELMVFITPHVVLNEEDSQFVTRDFKQRLKEIKADMQ